MDDAEFRDSQQNNPKWRAACAVIYKGDNFGFLYRFKELFRLMKNQYDLHDNEPDLSSCHNL